MEIVALSPLPVGSFLWQQRAGVWVLTVVSKATYTLAPGELRLAAEQEPINDRDRPWSEEIRSLYAASDLAPVKPRADVVLVGQAYAPGGAPVRSLLARLTVGDVDKVVEINCDRTLQADGSVQEGDPFARMPLLYERAAGGVATANPAGMSLQDRDAYGRAALPNLQRPGVVVSSARENLEPVGFGPIAADWPWRVEKLGRHAATWTVEQLTQRPMPTDIDPACFNAAPPDQRAESLAADEHIFLDNLHPEHRSLAAQLPGLRPVAFVDRRGGAQEVMLRADTLWIDTARLICTVTWRGHVSLERAAEEGCVYFGQASRGQTLTWNDLKPRGPAAIAPPAAPPRAPRAGLAISEETSMIDLGDPALASLPFARATSAQPRDVAPPPAAGLPFNAAVAPPQPLPPPRRAVESQVFASASPAPITAPVPIIAPPPITSSPPVVDSPWARGGSAAVVAVAAPSPAWPAPAPLPVPAPAQASSPLPLSSSTSGRVEPRLDPSEAIQLLWYDPESLPRIRRVARWRDLLRTLGRKPLDRDLDDPALADDPMELEDRREIFELLAVGESTDAPGVNEAITSAVREDGKFVAQLVLVAGELHLPFDELETLKATVTTVSPLVGQDESLRASVDAGKDFLATPGLLSSAAVAEGLTGRIKESFGQGRRVVPTGYLEAQVERVLLEKRHYQRREIFGAPHLRGLLQMAGSSAPIPTCLPEKLASLLPMYQRFKVRLVAQAELSVDQYESHQAALRGVALARTMHLARR
jgi:hypothetical protein